MEDFAARTLRLIPNFYRSIETRRDKRASVRGEHDRIHIATMPSINGDLLPRSDIPHSNRCVGTPGGQAASIWRESDRLYRDTELSLRLPRREVPEYNCAVVARTYESRAVSGK